MSVILVVMVFGIIEGGLLFRANLALANSADEAARRGSVEGNDPWADYHILEQIQIHSANPGAITKIVIYSAPDSATAPPAACRTASSTALKCNYYTPSDFSRPQSDFGTCLGVDAAWCPSSRDDTLRDADLLGVWIEGNFESPSGALGNLDLEALAVLPLESKGV